MEKSNPPICPFCSAPAVRTMMGDVIVFRCGTEGPSHVGEYITGHTCDMTTYTREIDRLCRERDRLTTALRELVEAGTAVNVVAIGKACRARAKRHDTALTKARRVLGDTTESTEETDAVN